MPQSRDPYAGLPPDVAQRLREMDEEQGRSRVTGSQAQARQQSAQARARVERGGGSPDGGSDRAAFPGFAAQADEEVRRSRGGGSSNPEHDAEMRRFERERREMAEAVASVPQEEVPSGHGLPERARPPSPRRR